MFDDDIEEENDDNNEEEATPEEGKTGEENDDDNTGDDETGDEKDTDDDKDDDKSGDKGDDDLIKDDDPKGVVKRIGRAVKGQRTAERENTKLREENAYLKGLKDGGGKEVEKEEPEVDVAPKEEDYDDYKDYLQAVAVHSGKEAVKEAMAVKETKDKADDLKTDQDTRKEAHQKRVEAAKEAHPDYEKVFADDGTVFINDEMYENIIDSEKGAEVAYYLAENPKEAQAIYDLDSPRAVSRAMGRIEDKVKVSTPQKSKDKPISKAPPPVSPSSGGKTTPTGARDDEPIGDWMKKENARVAALEE